MRCHDRLEPAAAPMSGDADVGGVVQCIGAIDGARPAEFEGAATIERPPDAPSAMVQAVWFSAAAVAIGLVIAVGWWRLLAATRSGPRPGPDPPRTMIAVMLWLLGGAAGAGLASAWVSASAGGGAEGAAALASLRGQGLVGIGSLLGQLPVLVWSALALRAPAGRPAPVSAIRSIWIGLAAVAVLWPVLQAVSALAGAVAALLSGDAPPAIAHTTLEALVREPTGGWRILVMVQAGLIAPVVEELVYRGLVQGGLRRAGLGPWTAIVATSTVFAVMHLGAAAPHALVVLWVLSVGFGWAAERTGGLLAPIVMHLVFNVANLALTLAMA